MFFSHNVIYRVNDGLGLNGFKTDLMTEPGSPQKRGHNIPL